MPLAERRVAPGSKVVFICPDHPEEVSDKPGRCPKSGNPLAFKIVSEGAKVVEAWICPEHPVQTADGKLKCPQCGSEMRRMEFEEVLSVPFSAVIDTGDRRVVYVDRGDGNFDGVEVTLGPRSGEYYQVVKGLAAGDRVVTAGAFLLDAEAHINPAAGSVYFGAEYGGGAK